ncbi:MAG: tyrosine-type recombinase/integrase [Thermoanaerobaculia bacterium]|nr:tyrosine-type recombinase/integrase [Thermoanaerobaculia bacterium]
MPRAFLNDDLVTRLRAVRRQEYWDTSTKSLVLRVEGESKTWWLVYWSPTERSISGSPRRRRYSIGRWPKVTVAGARREAERLRILIQNGLDPAREAVDGSRIREMGFTELGRRYIEEISKPNNATWRNDQWMLERVILPLWGNRPVSSITAADVQELARSVVRRGPVLANRAMTIVRQTLRLGVIEGLLPANPSSGLPKPGREKARTRVLAPAEIASVWQGCVAEPNPLAYVLMLRLLTAQRGREVLQLNLKDLEPAPGGLWWNLPAQITKARRPHRIFLTPTAVNILKCLPPSRHGWVFPQSDDPAKPVLDYSHVWNRIRRSCGTSGWDPRDLRRTAATLMSRNGVPRFIVRRVLNHADREVTAVYDLYEYDGEVRKALLTLEQAVLSITSGQSDLTDLLRSLPSDGTDAGSRAEPGLEFRLEPARTVVADQNWAREVS